MTCTCICKVLASSQSLSAQYCTCLRQDSPAPAQVVPQSPKAQEFAGLGAQRTLDFLAAWDQLALRLPPQVCAHPSHILYRLHSVHTKQHIMMTWVTYAPSAVCIHDMTVLQDSVNNIRLDFGRSAVSMLGRRFAVHTVLA